MIRWIGKTGLVIESDCVAWWFKVMYRFSRWIICDRAGLLLSDNMNDMFMCVSGELSCRSCHGILWKCSIFLDDGIFEVTSNEETEMATAAPPVMNENILDDEVIVIPDDPPELHSAEPTAGHAATPPVAGTSDQVREWAGPVDIHLLEYIESKTNKNTKRKMDQCVRRFREFFVESPHRETRDIGDIPAKTLDVLIGEFLIDLKKPDGSDYEPDSLTSFHCGIARYLQTIGYEYDIVKNSVFHTSKKVLEMRRRELKQSGKGNRPNRAESLSAEQEDRLWLTGQLGTDSAETVQISCGILSPKCWGSGVLTRPGSFNGVIWNCVKMRTLSFWNLLSVRPKHALETVIRNQESGIIYSRKFTMHAIYKRIHTVFIVDIDVGCWLL